jgi:hypothetical protein
MEEESEDEESLERDAQGLKLSEPPITSDRM